MELCEAGILGRSGVIIHVFGHRAQPTPAEAAFWKRVEPALAARGVRPPRVRELVDMIGVALDRLESVLGRREQLGWVHRVAENRYFLPVTLRELERIAEHVAAEDADGTFAAADFNRASGIGRNLTIKVLEYFDRIGLRRSPWRCVVPIRSKYSRTFMVRLRPMPLARLKSAAANVPSASSPATCSAIRSHSRSVTGRK